MQIQEEKSVIFSCTAVDMCLMELENVLHLFPERAPAEQQVAIEASYQNESIDSPLKE